MGIWYQLDRVTHHKYDNCQEPPLRPGMVELESKPLLITTQDERMLPGIADKLAKDLENELAYIIGCPCCVKVWIE